MKKTTKTSSIGLLIKKRRRELKISQEKLGEMIGVSYQQIQKYENAVNRVSADKLRDIASALNIDVSYFYEKPIYEEAHKEAAAYGKIRGISPDEKELIKSFRAIDDMEFRKRFLHLLICAAKRG
ncbi:MAG: helix-turn-helix transcriptional regulator [Deltaproteobacteria bacterium]|nr:helix-turn-helix transcriptional regulator [Deltaproteobacteria bacterium]